MLTLAARCAALGAPSRPGLQPGFQPGLAPGLAPGLEPGLEPGLPPELQRAQRLMFAYAMDLARFDADCDVSSADRVLPRLA